MVWNFKVRIILYYSNWHFIILNFKLLHMFLRHCLLKRKTYNYFKKCFQCVATLSYRILKFVYSYEQDIIFQKVTFERSYYSPEFDIARYQLLVIKSAFQLPISTLISHISLTFNPTKHLLFALEKLSRFIYYWCTYFFQL